MDVKNAFLHGDLKEEVYTKLPNGMPTSSSNTVCKLKRSLYGLKQAPRVWFEKFRSTLLGFSFIQSQYDPSLFLQRTPKGIVVLLVYVDDIVVTGSDQEGISKIRELLHSSFHMKELGRLTYFLGLELMLNIQGNLNLIKGTRNFKIPSHSFYADDLLVFCKGNLSGLKALKDLFDEYALESGQVINTSKSTIFSGSITPGKPKTCHLQPVADKIKLKLSAWKASLLSIAGKVQLVRDINFWNDSWCGNPLSEQLCIPDHISHSLSSTAFPNLSSIITSQATIPMDPSRDSLLWKHTNSGDLQLKDAYLFKMQQFQDLNWAKYIWSCDIPPSKSMLVWRLMHGKVPTDENLMIRGCLIPSMCNLCNRHVESSFHIFFECDYAIKLWSWFAGCVNLVLQFNSMEDMWKLCDLNWSPQCKITITATIINLINTLWLVRNQARFNNNFIPWRSAISLIIASTALTGNNTSKSSSNSIRDFTVLKMFRITIHHPIPPVLKEIIWQPPLLNWFKCNTDGASSSNPVNASCGGVFRDHNADFVYAFAEPLGFASSYFAELCGAMRAIEIAYDKNWLNIWLETDSSLVVAAFKIPTKPVVWPLRNRWRNVLFMINNMNCFVTHIYREGNKVADLIANHV
ncbi:hypothetical protein TSUD_416730 [Trifolium subterraneum]|uniref:Uncharacterized protein n=1 Tax=Trifolium subterraneum TaxID=3900 RepID=A0A2Z6P692_TRISU|nr:hypothetical protein TSUD_416730 [Trifolium subterraneum]